MKLIRILFLSITACALSIPVVLGFLLFLTIEEKPRVERLTAVAPEHIERARYLFDQHRQHSPQNVPITISILSEDIDIAANYLAKLFTHGKARVKLSHRQAEIHASLPIPLQSIKGYINFQATLTETAALPQLQSVHIGQLTIPDSVSQFLSAQLIEWLKKHPRYGNGINIIKNVRFSSKILKVAYYLPDKLSESDNYSLPVLSKSEQNKIYRYHLFLVQNSHRQHSGQLIPTNQTLSQILQPLMQMAAKYSEKNQAPVENRAAILAATFHILRLPLERLIPEAVHWPHAKYQVITLDGRQDFAQHFIVSAAITAYADTFLSDAIGLYKEIEDARSGSGFSFNDIAADRAGTLFGERATANQATALKLQQWATRGITDKDLMPVWADLPEHLPKSVFRQQFGHMDTPAYNQIMKKIEQRVSALPFLQ
ncbi:MAG: hypothetical protein KF908_09185 [Nitrosomonas sp.]|nr:hypothetical protein [Nitrosomonas sp.]